MEEIKIQKIAPILFEEQLRLAEITELISVLVVSNNFIKDVPKEKIIKFVNYTLSYNNIYDKTLEDIIKAVEVQDEFNIVIHNRPKMPEQKKFVNPEIYKIFYNELWKNCIEKTLYCLLNNKHISLEFEFSKKRIKMLYNYSKTPFNDFKQEIYELFSMNLIDIVIVDEGETYMLEIE